MRMRFLKIVTMYAAVALVACTSFKPIKHGPQDAYDFSYIAEQIRPGDAVEVETVQGELYALTVDVVDDDGIRGSGYSIQYADIKDIRKKQFSSLKTLGVFYSVVLILVIAFLVNPPFS